MNIREATQDDNRALQQLQAQCPMGTTLIVSTVNTPDFFARVKADADYKVYVAFEDERLIASAACAVRDAMVNGEVVKVGHVFQAFVHPEYRGRRIAGELLLIRESYLEQQGAALVYALIMEQNLPSMRHIERQNYKRQRTLMMPGIAVFKEMNVQSFGRIRTIEETDLETVVDLLNKTWQGYELYEPITTNSLLQFIHRTPGYDFENLLILEENDDIVACLGFWDWSKVTKIVVEKLNLRMRAAGLLTDITHYLGPTPRMPKPGQLLKQMMLTPVGFQNPRQMAVLLRYINNLAIRRDIDYIYFLCEKKHTLLSSLQGFSHVDTAVHLYIKPLREDVSIGKGPVFISGIDL